MYEYIIKNTKALEALLLAHGGTGTSLHDIINSLEEKLPEGKIKTLRYIAIIRNKVLHEAGFELQALQFQKFKNTVDQILREMELLNQKDQKLNVCICPSCSKPSSPEIRIYQGQASANICSQCEEIIQWFPIQDKRLAIGKIVKYCLVSIWVTFLMDYILIFALMLMSNRGM